jgi:hypothetical protein
MNDFIETTIKLTHSYIICKTCGIKADDLEKAIDKDFSYKAKTEKFELVYVYSLINTKFKYPNDESNVLYIGHTNGQITKNGEEQIKSAGFRFKHCMNGSDNKQNICLGQYYENGFALSLDIYDLKDSSAKEKENEYRYLFLRKYGALPIADGASYNRKKMEQISEIMENEEE